MDCTSFKRVLMAFVDDALSIGEHLEVMHHLERCGPCRQLLEAQRAFKEALREKLGLEEAPGELRRAIFKRLAREEGLRGWFLLHRRALFSGAAAALILLFLGGGVYSHFFGAPQELIHQAVTAHSVYYQGEAPLETSSSDLASLASWFKARLPFDVYLPSFRHKNWRLLGARLCLLMGKRNAHLFYRINGRKASLFIMEGKVSPLPAAGGWEKGGLRFHSYNDDSYWVIIWEKSGSIYTLVLDRSGEAEELKTVLAMVSP